MQPRHFFPSLFGLAGGCFLLAAPATAAEKCRAEHGRDIIFYKSLKHIVWSLKSLDVLWLSLGLPS